MNSAHTLSTFSFGLLTTAAMLAPCVIAGGGSEPVLASTAALRAASPSSSSSVRHAEDEEPEMQTVEHLYPVMWHDGAGGAGPRAWVWCGDALRCVSIAFADPRDEMNYRELSFRVKWQAQDPDFADQYFAPPAVCFSGYFEPGTDAWNRPRLRVSNWFVMPPFYRLNAEVEGVLDYAVTEKRRQLDASDFDGSPSERALHGVPLQKYVKSSGSPDAFSYPVTDIDSQAHTVTLLTHRSSEEAGSEELSPVCFTAKLSFADEEQQRHFFSEANVERVKRARAAGNGVALMLTGIREPGGETMRGLSFAAGEALAAVPAAPQPSLSERLLEAARTGDAEAARFLLAAGADVQARDRLLRETPLHRAAAGGHAGLVHLLLDAGADASAKDALGATPMHWVAARGCVCVTEPGGAEARAAAEQGASPSDPSTVAQAVEVVRLLAAAGADVNAADRSGRTPLYGAAAVGYADVLRALIAQGADVNARTKTRPTSMSSGPSTALKSAELFGRADCEQILRAAGATDSDAKTSSAKKP